MKEKTMKLDILYQAFTDKENELRSELLAGLFSAMEKMDELDILKNGRYVFDLPYEIHGEEVTMIQLDYSNDSVKVSNEYYGFDFDDVDTRTLKLMYDELVTTI